MIYVTLDVSSGRSVTGAYAVEDGVPVTIVEGPVLIAGGLQSPMPVVIVDGPTFVDDAGSAQSALAVSGLPEDDN